MSSQLKAAFDEFHAVQVKYRKTHGANDTEPDGVFQRMVHQALTSYDPVRLPLTPGEWQLFSEPGALEVVMALNAAATKVLANIYALRADVLAVQEVCWRIQPMKHWVIK